MNKKFLAVLAAATVALSMTAFAVSAEGTKGS